MERNACCITEMSDSKTNFARNLRHNQTAAEARLWSRLRNRQLCAKKFRRQFTVGAYVVDFACLEAKLVIELDGGQHAEAVAYDAKRTADIEACGFLVMRFWNVDVMTDIEAALATIHSILEPDAYSPA